ncbi:MAG TPA: hypothetical protein VFG79_19175 [Solirubrobacter sp.]|nr:hypothetical protein [Solirubrobacter sp.]
MRCFVLVLTVLAVAAAAPAASAFDDAWLWACRGPDGQPLGTLGDRATPTVTCGSGAALVARSGESWQFDMPANTTLDAVRIRRGGDLGSGGTYRLDAAQPLEIVTGETVPAGDATFPASGPRVSFGVTCDGECAGVEATALAFRVRDRDAPTGSVGGWHSPAGGTLALEVLARDRGLGLKRATAYLDGMAVDSAEFGDGTCADLSPGSSAIDLPFGRVDQNDVRDPSGDFRPVGCVGIGTATLHVDTNRVPDGTGHAISVTVTDFANNRTTVMANATEVINHPAPTSNTATLNIGTGGPVTLPSPGGAGPGGGVAGASASSCVAPRLSMRLAEKPLRIRKGVPVLRAWKAYRFKGRVTCVIGGRRRAAPKHVIVDIYTQRGRKKFDRNGRTTDSRGRLNLLLRFKKSRTLVFRVVGPNGRSDRVRIKLRVRKRKLRASVHARWFRFELPRDQVRFASLQARRVPKRARVRVRCSGGGCPSGFHRNRRPKHYRKHLSLMRGLAGANLRPGASVRVTITKRGYRGIGKLYCIRDGQRVRAIAYRGGQRRPRC